MWLVGIDPHKATHVAAVLDARGGVVATKAFPATAAGYQALRAWALGLVPAGEAVGWAVENPRGYGLGLAQYLVAAGEAVRSVAPHLTGGLRRRTPRPGKDDPRDAAAVARAWLQFGDALPPVVASGPIDGLAVLVAHHDDLTREQTARLNRLHAQLHALDPGYAAAGALAAKATRQHWRAKAKAAARRTTLPPADQARWLVVAALLDGLDVLAAQLGTVDRALARALRALGAAPLLDEVGVATYLAAKLIALTGHPDLFRDDAAWAMYAGVAPLDCSSGQQRRHRLNRGGNRQLNAAIHQVLLSRLRLDPATQAYVARKLQEGKTSKEAQRACKRHLARQLFRVLRQLPCWAALTPPPRRAA